MKKLMKRSIIGCVLVGVVYALAVFGLIMSSNREDAPNGVPVIIVLGARVVDENPAVPSRILAERLDEAYNYLVANPETVVVVTGGQGHNESEAEGIVMGRYLEEKGIEPSRIHVESTSTSTIENIRNALEIVYADAVIIVSSDYHIYRAKWIARSVGIETVYGQAAPSKTIAAFSSYLREVGIETVYGQAAPSKTIAAFSSYLREIVALGYHLIFTR